MDGLIINSTVGGNYQLVDIMT